MAVTSTTMRLQKLQKSQNKFGRLEKHPYIC